MAPTGPNQRAWRAMLVEMADAIIAEDGHEDDWAFRDDLCDVLEQLLRPRVTSVGRCSQCSVVLDGTRLWALGQYLLCTPCAREWRHASTPLSILPVPVAILRLSRAGEQQLERLDESGQGNDG